MAIFGSTWLENTGYDSYDNGYDVGKQENQKTKLTKEMCIDLVRGCGGPHYLLFKQMEKYGSYNDNRGWQWDKGELEKLPESHLMEIYFKCKKSWK